MRVTVNVASLGESGSKLSKVAATSLLLHVTRGSSEAYSITSFFHGEKRISSSEFEHAVNEVLLSDTVADHTKRHYPTAEGALAISAVWACVRILSETVGTLPIHLYHKTTSGREQCSGHPCGHILQKPNDYSGRFSLLHHLMIGCTLWGNGYARIHRDKAFRPVRLQLLQPYEVEPILTVDDELFYRLSTGEFVPAYDIIHLKGLSTDGYKGKSPIAVLRENLALTEYAQEYGEKFFNQGGNMSRVF